MLKDGFAPIITGGCLETDMEADRRVARKLQYRCKNPRLDGAVPYEPEDFPPYEPSLGGAAVRRIPLDNGGPGRCFESTSTSIGDNGWDTEGCDEDERHEENRTAEWFNKKQPFVRESGRFVAENAGPPSVRLKVAHLKPISIRPNDKHPQIVNVCQTFRFPDNFITQNNANRLAQQQHQQSHPPRDGSGLENGQQPEQLRFPFDTQRPPSKLGGFFGLSRHRQRNMHSQTSRTLLELVEAEQTAQQQQQQQQQQQSKPTGLPRTLNRGPTMQRVQQDPRLRTSATESTIEQRWKDREAKAHKHTRVGKGRPPLFPYFDRTKVIDGEATIGGQYLRSSKHTGVGRNMRHLPATVKPDHRKLLYEDSLESPFVSNPYASLLKLDAEVSYGCDAEDSVLDELDSRERECGGCINHDQPEDVEEDESEEETSGDFDRQQRCHGDNRTGAGTCGAKDGRSGIAAIMDKLEDNVWEVRREGIWDLMEIADRIDWKAQINYVTVITRKMVEFLKSPRTALCRSACQMSGELFREAKSTKRPEFDEIVDILLCKTADSNRFIQRDANMALDKLVTYIPAYHTVRALSNRGTTHRNPLVRTSTARLLVCICVVAGQEAILGTTANTRTRKTILSTLPIILMDKNLETRKFGERLYRMLSKHKYFNEYFYKDMDNNLRTNLKQVLKGIAPSKVAESAATKRNGARAWHN